MKAKPNEMQADKQDKPPKNLPIHTKGRLPADQVPKSERITAKQKVALRAIVWEGQGIAEAAKTAGLHGITLRKALARPHIQRALTKERDVFIAHARGQNIHHAVRLRECGNAAAEIRAVTFIEQVSSEQQHGGIAQRSPGMVVVVVQANGIDKPLNLQANSLELQAQALPCEGVAADEDA